MSRAATEYRYEKLTWPEINDAVDLGKVCIVPCGAVEQHGPHLPLDVDIVCPTGIATGAGREVPDKMLVLPVVAYGYTGHVMDFPGTINQHFEHFIHHVLDITKSLAYHGFKKIVLLNGHGSNMPNLDLVARRTNLETDAECVLAAWWNLLTVDKEFLPRWRQSKFPGGCAARLRARDVAVPVPRRRQRPQGPDQERHDLVQRGGQPVQLGGPVRGRPGDGHLVDEQLLRDRRPGRGGAGDGGEGPRGLRGGGEAAGAVRDVVQGPAEGRAEGPAPPAADDADAVGAAAGQSRHALVGTHAATSARELCGRGRRMEDASVDASHAERGNEEISHDHRRHPPDRPRRRHRRGRLGRGTRPGRQPPHHRRGRHRRRPRRRRQRLHQPRPGRRRGEAAPPAADRRAADEPARVSEKLRQNTFWQGRGGAVEHAISGIDIALWDLFGKISDQPVARLLGGIYRDRIKPYGSLLFDEPDRLREKLRAGGRPRVQGDQARLAAVRPAGREDGRAARADGPRDGRPRASS